MRPKAIILRETLLSMAINCAISIAFFFAMFGLARPVSAAALAWDFLPQAFMVALMGCLIPGLIVRKHGGQTAARIAARALLMAGIALLIAGGGFYLLFASMGGQVIAVQALVIKMLFGTALAAVTTPLAVAWALRPMAKMRRD